jgi:UDP-N-acetylmuramoyl-L-alanyl-D-glutamate--2,6-diaminopimelate ligase
MRLRELIVELGPCDLRGREDPDLLGVHHDSRKIGPKDVFVAIRGERVDGRRFVPGMRAAAVIADAPVDADPDVPVVLVPDARTALAQTAAALAGHPARKLPVVGITGTNGKTSIAWMLESMAHAAQHPAAVIGTTGHRIAGHKRPARHTTPEAPVIQQILREALEQGCHMAVMEVSSIGLALRRVDAIPFAVGVFTNLSQDHLDFHGDMHSYMVAKARLFEELMAPDGTAIINGDAVEHKEIRPRCARTWRFGTHEEHEIRLGHHQLDLSGCRAEVTTPMGEGTLRISLLGAHNLANALAALGAGLALGWSLSDCLEGLAQLEAIPGRMQPVPSTCGLTVLVDYAHSPDALRAVLESLRQITPPSSKIWTIFGCGGDRDRGKRPQMGAIAEALSDHTILTSDNPRSEDPLSIIDEVRSGMTTCSHMIPDRQEAIALAIQSAAVGDVVLVAGKGHETTQTIGESVLPFDDREVAADALRLREQLR